MLLTCFDWHLTSVLQILQIYIYIFIFGGQNKSVFPSLVCDTSYSEYSNDSSYITNISAFINYQCVLIHFAAHCPVKRISGLNPTLAGCGVMNTEQRPRSMAVSCCIGQWDSLLWPQCGAVAVDPSQMHWATDNLYSQLSLHPGPL